MSESPSFKKPLARAMVSVLRQARKTFSNPEAFAKTFACVRGNGYITFVTYDRSEIGDKLLKLVKEHGGEPQDVPAEKFARGES